MSEQHAAASARATPSTTAGAGGSAASLPSALPGRTHLLPEIADAVHSSGVLVLRGRPGTGVSAALATVVPLAAATGVRCLATAADRWAADDVGVLDTLLGELDGRPALVRPADADEVSRRLAGRGVCALPGPGGIAPGSPVVLVVDDAHLLGPTAQSLLAVAARESGVAVVVGAHGAVPALEDLPGARVLDLPGLDRAAVAEVVSRALGEQVEPGSSLAAGYARASGGEPGRLTALLDLPDARAALDLVRWAPDPSQTAIRLEDVLPVVVGGVVAGGGDRDLDAWAVLALAGAGAPSGLLDHALGAGWQSAGVAAGLLREGPEGVAYRHDAVRRLVEQTVPPAVRAGLLHRLAVAALESGCPPRVCARLLLAAGPVDVELAVRTAEDAAAHLRDAGERAEARALLTRVLELPVTEPAAR